MKELNCHLFLSMAIKILCRHLVQWWKHKTEASETQGEEQEVYSSTNAAYSTKLVPKLKHLTWNSFSTQLRNRII